MFAKRQSGFAIVRVTWFAHEAHLARALLEAEGIDAWVLDAEQVGVQWHVAGAIGGIKVAVREEDAYRARAVLAEDYSAQLDDTEEASLPAASEERCPRCGSTAIRSIETAQPPTAVSWVSMTAFFLLGLLVPRRRRRVDTSCAGCGHSWTAS